MSEEVGSKEKKSRRQKAEGKYQDKTKRNEERGRGSD